MFAYMSKSKDKSARYKYQQMEENQPHIKMSKNKNPEDFKVKDVEMVPNRFICFVKIKIYNGTMKNPTCKGSGVLIGEEWVLTAAHNIKHRAQTIQRINMMKGNPIDQSYIKLALHDGTDHGKYSIVSLRMAKKYASYNQNIHDYALIQIAPTNPADHVPQKFYPPVVALSEASWAKVKEISIYGHPVKTSQQALPDQDQSSVYMKNQYKASGNVKKVDDLKLSYKIPTEAGISGGPVFTLLNGEHVIVAIHKASTYPEVFGLKHDKDGQYENFGVNAAQMLEELNQWGYQLHKGPFAYTERTLPLRKDEAKIKEMEILYLADKGLDFMDMQVVTAYDLSNLKKIILSGNNLGEKGLECLTRRPLSALQSLFLPQNNIRSVDNIPEQNWLNIASVTLLVLSINGISSFPSKIQLLDKLQNLWLSYNVMREISDNLVNYCLGLNRKVNIFLYDNKIKEQLGANRQKRGIIEKSQAHIIWTREQKAHEFP